VKWTFWLPLVCLLPVTLLASSSTSDVPSQGRSGFDHFLHSLGDELPYPFDQLIKQVESTGGRETLGVFIPDGRSLQRFVSDPAHPRVAIVGGAPLRDSAPLESTGLPTFDSSQMFIAYSKKTNTLEVISYNETLGRPEYQLVTNYGPGLKPKVTYAPRSLCISCHQNESAIFTTGEWLETDENPELAKAMNAHHAEMYGLRNGAFSQFTNRSRDFAIKVERLNRLVQFRDVWNIGCAGPTAVDCRRSIVETALMTEMLNDPHHPEASKSWNSMKQALERAWPKEGLSVINSTIPVRDPKQFPNDQAMPSSLDPLTARQRDVLTSPSFQGDRPTPFSSEIHRTADLLASTMFTERDIDFLGRKIDQDPDKLREILRSPAMENLFNADFPGPRAFKEKLFSAAGAKLEVKNLAQVEKAMPPAEQGALPSHPLFQTSSRFPTLQLFKENCGSCHRNQSKKSMNFMDETDDAKLWENIKNNPEILRRISWESIPTSQQMPPANSLQGRKIRSEGLGRIEMIQELRSSLGVVPCLEKEIKKTFQSE
jgi:hypothetical protein